MNKVVLVGRLTKDPELRFTANKGTAVTRFTLAVNRDYKKEDGTQEFSDPIMKTVETLPERLLIIDTDKGAELQEQAENVKQLVEAYRMGLIKEKRK